MRLLYIVSLLFLVTLQVASAQSNDIVWMKGGHERSVLCAAISADGTTLASGSEDRTIRLWDIVTGNLVSILSGHTSDVTSTAFMPDGTLISGGRDSTIRFWNGETRQQERMIKQKGAVSQLGCSPDGQRLFTTTTDGRVVIGDLKADTMIAVFTASMFALSSDGLMIASGSADTVQLRDATNGVLLSQIPLNGSSIAALAFSLDGKFIAIGERYEFHQDDTVQVRDIASGEVVSILASPEDDRSDPLALAFISGDTVAVATSHFLQAWDVGDTQRLWSIPIDVSDYTWKRKFGLLPFQSRIVVFGERIQYAAPGNIYLPMLDMRLLTPGQVALNYIPYH
jgi:WD40 repeat protein